MKIVQYSGVPMFLIIKIEVQSLSNFWRISKMQSVSKTVTIPDVSQMLSLFFKRRENIEDP